MLSISAFEAQWLLVMSVNLPSSKIFHRSDLACDSYPLCWIECESHDCDHFGLQDWCWLQRSSSCQCFDPSIRTLWHQCLRHFACWTVSGLWTSHRYFSSRLRYWKEQCSCWFFSLSFHVWLTAQLALGAICLRRSCHNYAELLQAVQLVSSHRT